VQGREGRSHVFSSEKTDEPGSRKFRSGGEEIIRDRVLYRAQNDLQPILQLPCRFGMDLGDYDISNCRRYQI